MAGALDGAQVLVADDDEDSLEVLAFIVSQEGATVRTANNATGVLELLLTWTPDLLLLDISMPVMDGFELLSSIRGTARLGEIPAVAVTAHAYEVDRRRCLDAGFAEHVGKPYDTAARSRPTRVDLRGTVESVQVTDSEVLLTISTVGGAVRGMAGPPSVVEPPPMPDLVERASDDAGRDFVAPEREHEDPHAGASPPAAENSAAVAGEDAVSYVLPPMMC